MGASSPSSPSRTISRTPGAQSNAAHGTPLAMASSSASGKPSPREDWTKTEEAASAPGTSSVRPRQPTEESSPRPVHRAFRSASSSPVPYTSSRQSGRSGATSAQASRSMSMPFWSVKPADARDRLLTAWRGHLRQGGQGVGHEADVVHPVARPLVGVLLREDEPAVERRVVVPDPAVAVARPRVVVGLVAHPDDPQAAGVRLTDPLHRPDLADDHHPAGPGAAEDLRELLHGTPLPPGARGLRAPGGEPEAVAEPLGRPGCRGCSG